MFQIGKIASLALLPSSRRSGTLGRRSSRISSRSAGRPQWRGIYSSVRGSGSVHKLKSYSIPAGSILLGSPAQEVLSAGSHAEANDTAGEIAARAGCGLKNIAKSSARADAFVVRDAISAHQQIKR